MSKTVSWLIATLALSIGFILGQTFSSRPAATAPKLEQLEQFFQKNSMSSRERDIFVRTLAKAERCDDVERCSWFWELHGGSSYSTRPLVTRIHGKYGLVYDVVTAEVQRIAGYGEHYTPRFVIYQYSQPGVAIRADENGRMHIRLDSLGYRDWNQLTTSREEYDSVRSHAFDALQLGG